MRAELGSLSVFGRVALLAFGLAGCQLGGVGASDLAAPSAIQGSAVEVTALPPIGDAPPSGSPSVPPSVPKVDLGPDTPAAQAKAAPDPQKAAPPPATIKVKTPGQLACEKRGGSFVALDKSRAMTCQMPTRDGGKQCRRESDCEGVCLARSNTCAPVKPLLGCQAILQNDGRRVDLCID